MPEINTPYNMYILQRQSDSMLYIKTTLLVLLLFNSVLFSTIVNKHIDVFDPQIMASAAILIDYETGTILYEKNIDDRIPPASLTKLLTMFLTLKRIKTGKLTYQDIITINEEASADNMPTGSSLMYLKEGQRISIIDLLKGLAVASGNDAAVAVAQHLAGSVPAFINEMNNECKQMGFTTFHFEDPSGLSDKNIITAREFAEFCRYYIYRFPESLSRIHSIKSLELPGKKQYNRNTALWTFFGVDGLKTGYISASGYNLAITASQDGLRLIAVILGVPGKSHYQGRENIEKDAAELLSYGFENFNVIPSLVLEEVNK